MTPRAKCFQERVDLHRTHSAVTRLCTFTVVVLFGLACVGFLSWMRLGRKRKRVSKSLLKLAECSSWPR
jgi:hypothetical protein